jgi:hypothetical protein
MGETTEADGTTEPDGFTEPQRKELRELIREEHGDMDDDEEEEEKADTVEEAAERIAEEKDMAAADVLDVLDAAADLDPASAVSAIEEAKGGADPEDATAKDAGEANFEKGADGTDTAAQAHAGEDATGGDPTSWEGAAAYEGGD